MIFANNTSNVNPIRNDNHSSEKKIAQSGKTEPAHHHRPETSEHVKESMAAEYQDMTKKLAEEIESLKNAVALLLKSDNAQATAEQEDLEHPLNGELEKAKEKQHGPTGSALEKNQASPKLGSKDDQIYFAKQNVSGDEFVGYVMELQTKNVSDAAADSQSQFEQLQIASKHLAFQSNLNNKAMNVSVSINKAMVSALTKMEGLLQSLQGVTDFMSDINKALPSWAVTLLTVGAVVCAIAATIATGGALAPLIFVAGAAGAVLGAGEQGIDAYSRSIMLQVDDVQNNKIAPLQLLIGQSNESSTQSQTAMNFDQTTVDKDSTQFGSATNSAGQALSTMGDTMSAMDSLTQAIKNQ